MKRESATIKKIAAAWNKKLWGFYDLQKPKPQKKITQQRWIDSVIDCISRPR